MQPWARKKFFWYYYFCTALTFLSWNQNKLHSIHYAWAIYITVSLKRAHSNYLLQLINSLSLLRFAILIDSHGMHFKTLLLLHMNMKVWLNPRLWKSWMTSANDLFRSPPTRIFEWILQLIDWKWFEFVLKCLPWIDFIKLLQIKRDWGQLSE